MIPVSVLLPVYNGASYLKEAIESILTQSFSDFELIIINDGSTDESQDIISSFHDPRIVYIKNQNNLRLISTLNKGLELAKGKYIARMDADDIALPHRLRLQWEAMEANPEIDVIGSSIAYFDHTGVTRSWIVPTEHEKIKTELLAGPPFAHPTVFLRTASLRKHHLFYSTEYLHAEDYDLWIRMSWLGFRFQNISDVLLHYRLHNSNVSKTGSDIQMHHHQLLQVKQFEFILKRKLTNNEADLLFSEQNTVKLRRNILVAKKLYMEIIKVNRSNLYFDTERLMQVLNYILLNKFNFYKIDFNELLDLFVPPFVGSSFMLRRILGEIRSRL